jgi:hypothetical protein
MGGPKIFSFTIRRPPKLTAVECDRVTAFIDKNSRSSKVERLIATDIQRYIDDNFSVHYQ